MRRREFITLFGGVVTWPLAAGAQQADRMRRIGVLMGYAETDPAAQAQVAALRQGLQKLGWEDGRNIHVDIRFPGGDVSAVRTSLMELTRLTRTCWSPTPIWSRRLFRRKCVPYRLFSYLSAIRSVPGL